MTFARKEQVPVDAVLAYIEAKHTLDFRPSGEDGLASTSTFGKAWKQVMDVKRLRNPGDGAVETYKSERHPTGLRTRAYDASWSWS